MLTLILVLVGALVVLVLWTTLVGADSHASETLGLRSAQEIAETKAEAEAEDMDQMLAAHNRRRVAQGQREVSAEELEMEVMSDINREKRTARERIKVENPQQHLDEVELNELVEATNAQRRKQGLPERTRDDIKREYGVD